ncbi:MAG: AMP-binding protein, partial [Lachnospiraceae bacterium]|nr:AMP-binding protein [Lachnospiraceae bacterium]
MPITNLLEQNCKLYPEDCALVEINPAKADDRRVTWREYDLVQSSHAQPYRREITWRVFNEKANRFANLLLERGIGKDDKVGILLMNCLEWLPIYFGVLKTGAIAVPFNFRYDAEEILYCAELAEVDMIVFGPEFIGRIEEIADRIITNRLLFFFGENCPTFAEDYNTLTADCSSMSPNIMLTDKDDAAIWVRWRAFGLTAFFVGLAFLLVGFG